MPIRKEAVGQEMIYDAVIVAVQLWPVEHLAQSEKDQEAVVLNVLCRDVQRILRCLYGEERFQGYWILGMQRMLPVLIDVMHDWWKRRKDNRAKLGLWRRKWVIE